MRVRIGIQPLTPVYALCNFPIMSPDETLHASSHTLDKFSMGRAPPPVNCALQFQILRSIERKFRHRGMQIEPAWGNPATRLSTGENYFFLCAQPYFIVFSKPPAIRKERIRVRLSPKSIFALNMRLKFFYARANMTLELKRDIYCISTIKAGMWISLFKYFIHPCDSIQP
jgi:hypothetical protein